MTATILLLLLSVVVTVLLTYTVRHYVFTFNRLFGRHRQPYADVMEGPWPSLTVLVPCHNEEQVIAGSLDAILANDYPRDRLTIVPIDDRSKDGTAEILRRYERRYPGLVKPYFRTGGTPGKGAALVEVAPQCRSEVHLLFDADYVPGPRLLKQLTAPFFDPEVGVVMGRVIPQNVQNNLLTRLLDLERSGGYQVDQQARMNLGLVPQYGGTVGGVRVAALESVGGWGLDALAEDTDMTFKMLLNGWQVVYQNRSECYEEVPESWPTRTRQIRRWARGHNQSLARYFPAMLRQVIRPTRMTRLQALDGILLLGVFALAPVLALGWILALTVYYLGYQVSMAVMAVLVVSAFSTLGNFAAFFEVAAATRLDGSRNRVRLLPFLVFGFLVNLVSVSFETLRQLFTFRKRGDLVWHKTERYRRAPQEVEVAIPTFAAADLADGNGAPLYAKNGNGNGTHATNGNGVHATNGNGLHANGTNGNGAHHNGVYANGNGTNGNAAAHEATPPLARRADDQQKVSDR